MTLDTATAKLLHKALTESGEGLLQIVQQAPQEILQAALRNPSLAENHLSALLKRRDLGEDLIKNICKLSLTEANHNLKVAIARHPNTPAPQLLAILPQLHLFELLNLCLLPEITPDQKVAAERVIIQRLPLTPLGNRLTLARRATSALLEALIKEGDPRLVEICLANPRLKEGTLFQFVRSGAATAETISMVARSPRWQNRPTLREAILSNPKTPLVWFTLWLPGMKLPEIKRLVLSNRLTVAQKKAVEERLKGR
jgi:hypothetical protein